MDNLEPYDLGIPKEVKAFIRPVSKLGKRTLDTAVDLYTTKAPTSYSSVCRCENMDSCPAEKRDYITFRKSCPYGQVQCCRTFGNRDGFVNLSKISGPAQVSQIRPVHIPVPIVPTTTTTTVTTSTTTTQSTTTETSTTAAPITTPLSTTITTTTTTEGPTPAQTTASSTISPSRPTTTPAPVTLFSATPYTIVSSSFSVTKLEWDNTVEDDEKVTTTEEDTTTTTPQSTTKEEVATTTNLPPVPKLQPRLPPRQPIFITPQRNTPHHLLRVPGPPQRLPVPRPHPQRLAPGQAPPTRHTRPVFVSPQQQGAASQPLRVFVPHGQRPPGPLAPQAAVPGQVVFVGNDGKVHRVPPHHQQPLRRPTPQQIQQQQLFRQQLQQQQKPLKRQIKPQDVQGIRPAEKKWPRPTPFLQPPSSTRFIDRAGQETGRGHQLGFVESIGQAAINVATGLFSWPFQFK